MSSVFSKYCEKCGSCCRCVFLLNMEPIKDFLVFYNIKIIDLDRGDGVCRYFDEELKLCTIYENRPLLCNSDAVYELLYLPLGVTKESYLEMVKNQCEKVKMNVRENSNIKTNAG